MEGAPELLDFNELGYAPVESYPEMEGLPAQDVYNCETHKWTTIKYLYWKEFLFPRFTYARSQWIIPSDDLVSLYDQQNDRRFKLFLWNMETVVWEFRMKHIVIINSMMDVI